MLPAALLHVINMLYEFIRCHHCVRPAVNAQRLEAIHAERLHVSWERLKYEGFYSRFVSVFEISA